MKAKKNYRMSGTFKSMKLCIKGMYQADGISIDKQDFSVNFFRMIPGEEKFVEYKKKNEDITYTLNT